MEVIRVVLLGDLRVSINNSVKNKIKGVTGISYLGINSEPITTKTNGVFRGHLIAKNEHCSNIFERTSLELLENEALKCSHWLMNVKKSGQI